MVLIIMVCEHQFKYYVDNEWTHDKNKPAVDNDLGSNNNVITIKQDDLVIIEEITTNMAQDE